MPAAKAWGTEFSPQHPHTKLGVLAFACNPSSREVDTGRSLGFASHQPHLTIKPQVSVKGLSQTIRWIALKEPETDL